MKVGDRVIYRSRWTKSRETTVSRVGRLYFYVECDRHTKFRLRDKHSVTGDYSVSTPEEHAREQRIELAKRELREFGFPPEWSVKDARVLAMHEAMKAIAEAELGA